MWKKKVVFVVCEGSSDAKYLQWLSSFFNGNNIPLVLKPSSIGSGDFLSAKKKYKEIFKSECQKKHSKPDVIVWVDKDIYIRNEGGNRTKYEKKESLPDFKFSYMNYEDFLTLHDNDRLKRWTAICRGRDHFSSPMINDDYSPLFEKHMFREYQKGILPEELVRLDDNEKAVWIRTMLTNNRKAEASGGKEIHCDFASYLANLLEQIKAETSDAVIADFIGNLLPQS